MTMVSTTPRAMILSPWDHALKVTLRFKTLGDALEKAWPAGPAVILHIARIEGKFTGRADERPTPVFVIQWTCSGSFGSSLKQHPISIIR